MGQLELLRARLVETEVCREKALQLLFDKQQRIDGIVSENTLLSDRIQQLKEVESGLQSCGVSGDTSAAISWTMLESRTTSLMKCVDENRQLLKGLQTDIRGLTKRGRIDNNSESDMILFSRKLALTTLRDLDLKALGVSLGRWFRVAGGKAPSCDKSRHVLADSLLKTFTQRKVSSSSNPSHSMDMMDLQMSMSEETSNQPILELERALASSQTGCAITNTFDERLSGALSRLQGQNSRLAKELQDLIGRVKSMKPSGDSEAEKKMGLLVDKALYWKDSENGASLALTPKPREVALRRRVCAGHALRWERQLHRRYFAHWIRVGGIGQKSRKQGAWQTGDVKLNLFRQLFRWMNLRPLSLGLHRWLTWCHVIRTREAIGHIQRPCITKVMIVNNPGDNAKKHRKQIRKRISKIEEQLNKANRADKKIGYLENAIRRARTVVDEYGLDLKEAQKEAIALKWRLLEKYCQQWHEHLLFRYLFVWREFVFEEVDEDESEETHHFEARLKARQLSLRLHGIDDELKKAQEAENRIFSIEKTINQAKNILQKSEEELERIHRQDRDKWANVLVKAKEIDNRQLRVTFLTWHHACGLGPDRRPTPQAKRFLSHYDDKSSESKEEARSARLSAAGEDADVMLARLCLLEDALQQESKLPENASKTLWQTRQVMESLSHRMKASESGCDKLRSKLLQTHVEIFENRVRRVHFRRWRRSTALVSSPRLSVAPLSNPSESLRMSRRPSTIGHPSAARHSVGAPFAQRMSQQSAASFLSTRPPSENVDLAFVQDELKRAQQAETRLERLEESLYSLATSLSAAQEEANIQRLWLLKKCVLDLDKGFFRQAFAQWRRGGGTRDMTPSFSRPESQNLQAQSQSLSNALAQIEHELGRPRGTEHQEIENTIEWAEKAISLAFSAVGEYASGGQSNIDDTMKILLRNKLMQWKHRELYLSLRKWVSVCSSDSAQSRVLGYAVRDSAALLREMQRQANAQEFTILALETKCSQLQSEKLRLASVASPDDGRTSKRLEMELAARDAVLLDVHQRLLQALEVMDQMRAEESELKKVNEEMAEKIKILEGMLDQIVSFRRESEASMMEEMSVAQKLEHLYNASSTLRTQFAEFVEQNRRLVEEIELLQKDCYDPDFLMSRLYSVLFLQEPAREVTVDEESPAKAPDTDEEARRELRKSRRMSASIAELRRKSANLVSEAEVPIEEKLAEVLLRQQLNPEQSVRICEAILAAHKGLSTIKSSKVHSMPPMGTMSVSSAPPVEVWSPELGEFVRVSSSDSVARQTVLDPTKTDVQALQAMVYNAKNVISSLQRDNFDLNSQLLSLKLEKTEGSGPTPQIVGYIVRTHERGIRREAFRHWRMVSNRTVLASDIDVNRKALLRLIEDEAGDVEPLQPPHDRAALSEEAIAAAMLKSSHHMEQAVIGDYYRKWKGVAKNINYMTKEELVEALMTEQSQVESLKSELAKLKKKNQARRYLVGSTVVLHGGTGEKAKYNGETAEIVRMSEREGQVLAKVNDGGNHKLVEWPQGVYAKVQQQSDTNRVLALATRTSPPADASTMALERVDIKPSGIIQFERIDIPEFWGVRVGHEDDCEGKGFGEIIESLQSTLRVAKEGNSDVLRGLGEFNTFRRKVEDKEAEFTNSALGLIDSSQQRAAPHPN